MKGRLCKHCNSLSPYHEPTCRKCGKVLAYIKIEDAKNYDDSEFHPFVKRKKTTKKVVINKSQINYQADPISKIKNWSYFFIFASILNLLFLIESSHSTSWGIPISFFVFPVLLISYIIFWIVSISTYNRMEKELKTSTKYLIELLINLPILIFIGGFIVLT